MRSPAAALVWEIWSRSRTPAWAIVILTAFRVTQPGGVVGSPVLELAGMLSFVLLFAIFHETEFPLRRLTLPVSSLQLIAVPLVLGVLSVELLYAIWAGPLARGGSTDSLTVAALFGAFMVSSQTATWTLASYGALRLVAIGVLGGVFLDVGLMSSAETSTTVAAGAAVAAVAGAWTFVGRMRSGGGARTPVRVAAIDVSEFAWRPDFARFVSPAAAQGWLEWRLEGVTLPALVGGLLLVVVAPVSWIVRADQPVSTTVLMLTLAMPMALAVPVGVAFCKPRFWSDDLSVPDFLAVRPLASDDWVAIKLRVAAKAAASSWLLVFTFLALWLPLWFDHFALRQIWPGWTRATLIVGAAMFVTWRLLVVRLWAGLSGSRRLYFASGVSAVFIPIAGALFKDDIRSVFEDPRRLDQLFWILMILVLSKYGVAALLWIRIDSRNVYRSRVLLTWLGSSLYFVTLSRWLYGWRGLPILFALLVPPIGRLLAAPLALAKNRHRG
ncbi:MAG: hypothetical protein ACRD1V_09255 [Vicinamibacterales bacterium]